MPEEKIGLSLSKLIPEANLLAGLNLKKGAVYSMIRKGCPYLKLNGKRFFYEPDFMAWALTQTGSGDSESESPEVDEA